MRLNLRLSPLIFFLTTCLACSSQKEFQFISFETFISDKDSYPRIEETHFLYMDTTLYSQLVAAEKIDYPLQLMRYSIHTNDVFIVDSEYQYKDVRELLRDMPIQVYDFLYEIFGFTRKSMNISKIVLIYDNKAYIEIHNKGTHVGIVITPLSGKRVSLGIAYVLTS